MEVEKTGNDGRDVAAPKNERRGDAQQAARGEIRARANGFGVGGERPARIGGDAAADLGWRQLARGAFDQPCS